jgi:hypothetical protein
MATAEQKLALLPWTPEGRTLGALVKDLVGPVAWPLLLQMTGESERPAPFNGVNRIYLVPDPAKHLGIATDNPQPYIAAVKACFQLRDLWISELVANGRRDDRLAPATEIRPPTNWQVVILSLTDGTIMVDDPGKWNGPKIYDLRFSPRSPTSVSRKQTNRFSKRDIAHAAAVDLWPPDGVAPADIGPGEIERQVIDRVQKQQGRRVAISPRTILRAAGRP